MLLGWLRAGLGFGVTGKLGVHGWWGMYVTPLPFSISIPH